MKMTLHDAIGEVKRTVTARQVCEMYGLKVNDNGFALCPWHDDTKPSMKVYDGQKGVFCFACSRGGSVIDLCMAIHNEPLRDAVNRLVRDFGIDVQVDGNAGKRTPPPPDYRRLYEAELKAHAEDLKDLAALTEAIRGGHSEVIEQAVDEIEDRLYNERRSA